MRVAAVQLEVALGRVQANLRSAEQLVRDAVRREAELVVLPEFFTTGMAYHASVRAGIVPFDGPVTDWLIRQARTYQITVGGSFLCRDGDGHVRNAFVLADPDGMIGRHDKDLPTMWENAFYVPGADDGVLRLRDGTRVGVALCWELMRSQTVRRLRGRVDVVLAGSAWWSVPSWPPARITRRWEAQNARTAATSVRSFPPMVGAPIVHASLCGSFRCPALGLPLRYAGHYEGPTGVYESDGRALVERGVQEGGGVVVTDIELGAVAPSRRLPGRYWLHPRGPLPAFAWNWQQWLGRREYARTREAFWRVA